MCGRQCLLEGVHIVVRVHVVVVDDGSIAAAARHQQQPPRRAGRRLRLPKVRGVRQRGGQLLGESRVSGAAAGRRGLALQLRPGCHDHALLQRHRQWPETSSSQDTVAVAVAVVIDGGVCGRRATGGRSECASQCERDEQHRLGAADQSLLNHVQRRHDDNDRRFERDNLFECSSLWPAKAAQSDQQQEQVVDGARLRVGAARLRLRRARRRSLRERSLQQQKQQQQQQQQV